MPNILDGCAEEGPLLTPALSKPKTITKAAKSLAESADVILVSDTELEDLETMV